MKISKIASAESEKYWWCDSIVGSTVKPYKAGDLIKEVQFRWNFYDRSRKMLPLKKCEFLIDGWL